MIVTDALVKLMERAENPRAIRLLSRALEVSTGLDQKNVIATFGTTPSAEWYQREGHQLIARALGSGGASLSGISVTRDSAFNSAAVYASVKIIAEDLGSLPFFFYERSRDGLSVTKATKHSLFRLLHDLPNPETSAGEFVESLTAHALLCGNGYAQIVRDDADRVIGLYPWMPETVTLMREQNTGRRVYQHTENGKPKNYRQEDVFHLRGFTLNGTSGENLLNHARHVLGLTLATQEYPARYFSQGSLMDVVLERPAGLPQLGPELVQAIKEAWKKWHQGLKNAHEPGVLQDGMTAKILTPKHTETQLIEQRKFQVLEVCRLFRLPPHKLADMERSAYASIEAENIAYRTNTLSPWTRRWSEAVHRCLLSPAEQAEGRLFAEHNMEALMRGDFKTQAEAFRALLEKGVYSINEVRRLLNLNPVDGGDGHFVQLNMVDVTAAAQAAADGATRVIGATGMLQLGKGGMAHALGNGR